MKCKYSKWNQKTRFTHLCTWSSCFTVNFCIRHVRVGPQLGQIYNMGHKGTNLGIFKIGTEYWYLKTPKFVPFGANLTKFYPKCDLPLFWMSGYPLEEWINICKLTYLTCTNYFTFVLMRNHFCFIL